MKSLKIYQIDEDILTDILLKLGYKDISIIYSDMDFSGVEIPLPTIDIVYDSVKEIDEDKFKKAVIKYII